MAHTFRKNWLKFSAFIVGSFGPVFFLGTMVETVEPARWTLDILSWPVDGQTTYSDPDTRFLSALAGGFLLGWGVMIWGLAHWVYDLAPDAVRKCLLVSALAWFCLDSAGSVASGNASNVLFNSIILLLVVGPFWRPAPTSKI